MIEYIKDREEFYIKGEESNADKRTKDAKEKCDKPKATNIEEIRSNTTTRESYFQTYTIIPRTLHSTKYTRGTGPFRCLPCQTHSQASHPKGDLFGNDSDKWCKYHRIRSHHTDVCHHLKREIKMLIQGGLLQKYV